MRDWGHKNSIVVTIYTEAVRQPLSKSDVNELPFCRMLLSILSTEVVSSNLWLPITALNSLVIQLLSINHQNQSFQQKIVRLKVGSIVQTQFEAASGAKQTIHQVNKVVLQCSAHCDTSTRLRPNAASIASLMRPHQAGPLQGKGRKVIKSMHALVIPVMVLIQTRGYQMQSRISLLELFVVCSDMSQQKKTQNMCFFHSWSRRSAITIQETQTTIEECQLGNSCFMGLEPPLQIIASLLHQCEDVRHPQ